MPLVAPLGPIIVALVAAMLIWAAYTLFRPLLVALANNVPVLGHTLAQVIDSTISWAWAWAKAGAETALVDLVGVVATPLHWIATLFDNLASGQFDTYSVLVHLRFTVIPREISGALSIASGWVAGAQRYALSLYQQGVDYTTASVGQLRSFTVASLSALTSYAGSLFSQAINYTTAGLSTLASYDAALFNQAISYAAAGDSDLEHYAATLFNQAVNYTGVQVTDLENWAAARLTAIQDWTGTQVIALDGAIALARTDAIAFTRAEVGTVELDLAKLKAECTDNLCGNLGGLANLFNLISGAWEITTVIGLIGEVMRDPGSAANALDETIGAPARALVGTIVSGG